MESKNGTFLYLKLDIKKNGFTFCYNKEYKSFMHCTYVYKRHTKQFIVTNLVSMLIPLGDPY